MKILFALFAISSILLALPTATLAATDGEIFDDWRIKCAKEPRKGFNPCHMFQYVREKKSNNRLLRLEVTYLPRSKVPTLVISVPLGFTYLAPGLAIVIDDNEPKILAYDACFRDGCKVEIPMTENILNKFKTGSKGAVLFHTIVRQKGRIQFSLSGFGKALKSIKP